MQRKWGEWVRAAQAGQTREVQVGRRGADGVRKTREAIKTIWVFGLIGFVVKEGEAHGE